MVEDLPTIPKALGSTAGTTKATPNKQCWILSKRCLSFFLSPEEFYQRPQRVQNREVQDHPTLGPVTRKLFTDLPKRKPEVSGAEAVGLPCWGIRLESGLPGRSTCGIAHARGHPQHKQVSHGPAHSGAPGPAQGQVQRSKEPAEPFSVLMWPSS